MNVYSIFADVAELADALDLGSSVYDVQVQLLSSALISSDLDIFSKSFFFDVRLAAHVSKGLKSRIRPVVGRI